MQFSFSWKLLPFPVFYHFVPNLDKLPSVEKVEIWFSIAKTPCGKARLKYFYDVKKKAARIL